MIRNNSRLDKLETQIKEKNKTNRVFLIYITEGNTYTYKTDKGEKEIFTTIESFKEKYNINDSDTVLNIEFVSPKEENNN